ncbi:hypothetical protein GBBBJNDB_00287 [Pseudomonas phage Callisto]|nr:hypothetical protein GBBBJNDB_00287 [Pseudomonas phage Callisto]
MDYIKFISAEVNQIKKSTHPGSTRDGLTLYNVHDQPIIEIKIQKIISRAYVRANYDKLCNEICILYIQSQTTLISTTRNTLVIFTSHYIVHSIT